MKILVWISTLVTVLAAAVVLVIVGGVVAIFATKAQRWDLLAWAPPGWGYVLVRGLIISIGIAVGGYIMGLLLGLGGALGKLYGGPILKNLLEGYTTIVRAVPELILILLLYYAGTQFLTYLLEQMGFQRIDINGVLAGIVVLGFVQGAYSTEVLRGAIQSIPFGQIDAAKAYGMSGWLRFHRVVIPAMLPLAIPGLANLWLIITKDTALLAVVGIDPSELSLATRQAAGHTKQYFLFFMAAFFLYLALSFVSNLAFRALERRVTRGQPSLVA